MKSHSDTDVHKEAEIARVTWTYVQKVRRVDQQLDPSYLDKKLVSEHKQHLLTVLDVILFRVEQKIALRGDDESKESLNKGNFFELLTLLSKYDKSIQERLDKLPKMRKMI